MQHFSFAFSNKTLWNVLTEPNLIDTKEFEDLFAKVITHTKRKPLSETYEKKAKAKKVSFDIINQIQVQGQIIITQDDACV